MLVASLVAGVVALGVGGVFLLLPFGHSDPGVGWGSLVMYALIVPGAAAGFRLGTATPASGGAAW